MPSTPVLGLPYPANTALLNQGFDAIGDLAQAVEDELIEEGWHTVGAGGQPAFASGASNTGSGYQTMQFKKVGNAVRLRGVVNAILDVFTLPVGYRPTLAQNFAVVGQFGDTIYGEVLSTGVVSLHKVGGGSMSGAGMSATIWVD